MSFNEQKMLCMQRCTVRIRLCRSGSA